MQVLAEQLSGMGASLFVSDIKGDASGFCVPGLENERNALAPYKPHGIETNYWSASSRFIPLRFSLRQVGSVLLSRLLSLNPTQESHLSLAFSYARRNGKPLDDIEELLGILDEMVSSGQRGISASSVSVIERKALSLQESGLSSLFGRPSLDFKDLSGMNVLNLSDARKDMGASIAPAFLLQMLFESLPEVGDVETPRFVIFFDEAHYLFKDANKSLRDLMVTILKQIRSKGVSVFFVTQDVSDLPDEVLSQLSTKIIFSQKVFTSRGNSRLKALAFSFPSSRMDVMERLKSLPPGSAIFSTLDQGGNQTPPREVRVFAPASTMQVVPDGTLKEASDPKLMAKYSRTDAPPMRAPAAGPPPATAAILRADPRGDARIEPKPAKAQDTRPRTAKNEKGRKGSSIWDAIFSFLLKLLDFLLKAGGRIFTAIILKPGKSLIKWMSKRPLRAIYLLLFLLLLYFLLVNWALVSSLLSSLKLG